MEGIEEKDLKRKRSPSPDSSVKRQKKDDGEALETGDAKVEDFEDDEVVVDDGMYWQDNWLPDDILFLIMYRLARIDLVSCRMACKQWSKVGFLQRTFTFSGVPRRTFELGHCFL